MRINRCSLTKIAKTQLVGETSQQALYVLYKWNPTNMTNKHRGISPASTRAPKLTVSAVMQGFKGGLFDSHRTDYPKLALQLSVWLPQNDA